MLSQFWTVVGLWSAVAFCAIGAVAVFSHPLMTILSAAPTRIRRNPFGAILGLSALCVLVAYGGSKPEPTPVPPPEPTVVEIPEAVEGLVYNGEEQTGVPAGEGYSITGNVAVEAGDYTAIATLVGTNSVWSDGTTAAQEIPWSIAESPEPPPPPPPEPEYVTGEPIDPITLEVAVDAKVKVSGLPSGLKFTAKAIMKKGSKTEVEIPANTIYGTPTKSGVAVATITVTPNGGKAEVSYRKFIFRRKGEPLVDVVWNPELGKVTGAGVYKPGKKVTLKAMAAKGHAFSGWYDEADVLVTQAASLSFDATAEDVRYEARFVTVEEDAASIKAAVDGVGLSPSTAYGKSVMCGVALRWPVAVSALSLPKVKVSGLPSGLKFTAKDIMKKGSKTEIEVPANTIYGAPKAASKPGKPSAVKLTVTTSGKSKVTYMITLTVEALPAWAVGTFDGNATMKVSAAGKVSGKAGKTALSATCFSAYENGVFSADMTFKDGKEVRTNKISVFAEDAAGWQAGRIVADDSQPFALDLVQNPWLRKELAGVVPTVRTKPAVTCDLGGDFTGVTLTIKAKGVVQAAGKLADGSKFSAKAQLILVHNKDYNGLVVLNGESVRLNLEIDENNVINGAKYVQSNDDQGNQIEK